MELPSQLYEHWLSEREVLERFAVHQTTHLPISEDLINKMKAAQCFNKGFDTVEYLASALVDQAVHKLSDIPEDFDITQFEKEELQRLGMPSVMVMRHGSTHFAHIFSGNSYASAYYVYLWAEVLDAGMQR